MNFQLFILAYLILATNSCQKTNIAFIESTSQNWSGGAAGSGRGVNYIIKVKADTGLKVTADSIWLNEKRLVVRLYRNESNDTITLKAMEYFPDHQREKNIRQQQSEFPDKESGKIKSPVPFKGVALLRYFIDEKEKYFIVKEFKIQPAIYYP